MNAKPADARNSLAALRQLRDKLRAAELRVEHEILLRQRGLHERPVKDEGKSE
jgi:hypothetical protein